MTEFYKKWLYRNAPLHVFQNEIFFDTPLEDSYNESILKSNIAHHLAEYAIRKCLKIECSEGIRSIHYHGLMYAFAPDELVALLEKLANEISQTFNFRSQLNSAPLDGLPIENSSISHDQKLKIEDEIHASIVDALFPQDYASSRNSAALANKFINLLLDGKFQHISINYGKKNEK